MNPEIIYTGFHIAFILVFGLLAYFVKPVRITSCFILMSVAANLWMLGVYNELAAQGESAGYLIMGCFDLVAALSLAIFWRDPDAKKSAQQSIIFVIAMLCHGRLAFETMNAEFYFYEVYDYAIWGLSIAQLWIMGEYYGDLQKTIKKKLGVFFTRGGFRSGGSHRDMDKELRTDVLDNPARSGRCGRFRSGEYDTPRETGKG